MLTPDAAELLLESRGDSPLPPAVVGRSSSGMTTRVARLVLDAGLAT